MRPLARRAPLASRPPRGSALVFALCLVLVLAVAVIAIVRIAGQDRIAAAQLGVKDRGLACAEAGLQYARRFFGTTYETSGGWATYLADGSGYRYDYENGDTYPSSYSSLPAATKGPNSANPDYWVSIRDDDDETPVGRPNDKTRDNNEMIIIRSECINKDWQMTIGGEKRNVVIESTLVHIQSSSGYATSGPTNAPDLVGTR